MEMPSCFSIYSIIVETASVYKCKRRQRERFLVKVVFYPISSPVEERVILS
jgi:hypothetical protein